VILLLFKKLEVKEEAEHRPTLFKMGPINITHGFLLMAFNITYCLEENMKNYYYDLRFNLSPSFIFGCLMIITYIQTKETQDFNMKVQYIYIINFFLFLYYPSINNFIDFFLPIYIVLGIFVFINILVKEYLTKVSKTRYYKQFLEDLIISILKTDDFFVTLNDKIILKNPDSSELTKSNLLTNDKLNNLKDNITSNLSDLYENEEFNNIFMKTFEINENLYKGFNLVKKDYKNINVGGSGKIDFSFMIWIILYLKDSSLIKFSDSEIIVFYDLLKEKLKPSNAKNFLVTKIEKGKNLIPREKLLCAIFLYVLEIGLSKDNIQIDKIIVGLSTNNKDINLKLLKSYIEENSSILGLMNTFQDVITFFGLKFHFKIDQIKIGSETKQIYDFDLSFENEINLATPKLSNSGNFDSIFGDSNNLNLVNLMSERGTVRHNTIEKLPSLISEDRSPIKRKGSHDKKD